MYENKESFHLTGSHFLKNLIGTDLPQLTKLMNLRLLSALRFYLKQNLVDLICVYDIGAGSEAAAVKEFIKPYRKEIFLFAADASYSVLSDLITNNVAGQAIYYDFNYVDSWKQHSKLSNKVHILTCKNVLHQCIDFTLGISL